MITAAKALGGGLPVGAVITTPELGDVLQPGDHGSTFAGGPIGAAAALEALDVLGDAALLASVRERGARFEAGLAALDGVAEVRGRGLMVGVTLADGIDAAAVTATAPRRRLVINCPGRACFASCRRSPSAQSEVDQALGMLGRSGLDAA